MAVNPVDPKSNKRPKRAYRLIGLKKQHPKEAALIQAKFKLSPVPARVLAARGYKAEEDVETYINPTLKGGLPKPSQLKNLDEACDLIGKTVDQGQGIAICCDFDVDGLSGGAIAAHFLRCSGAKVAVFVPDRFLDGYGLNEQTVRKIAKAGFGLLLAIDFGSTNLAELRLARELGLKTVVVDHHHLGVEVPPADVLVNPHQAGCNFAGGVLCAAGLVWYLIIALRQKLAGAKELDPKSYLDLACLGTICDMVPLTGANRVIAKRGLETLSSTSRPGLVALKNVIGLNKDVSCTHVSFGLGPRLNAAGRMVHGEVVIDLLTTDDSGAAQKIAGKLNKLNLERQETEAKTKELAVRQVEKNGELPCGIVVWDKKFHTGVIGLVAQRMVELFYRPAAVIGSDDGKFRGSVRGIPGFNVVDALAAVSEHLIRFGGHEGAGGFSVAEEKLEAFAEAFKKECETRLQHLDSSPHSEADTEVELRDIDLKLIEELKNFAPFGMGNPAPTLLIRNLRVNEVKVLKNEHMKVSLSDGYRSFPGLFWRQTSHPALVSGTTVDVVCRPDTNVYGGTTQLQLTLHAAEKAS